MLRRWYKKWRGLCIDPDRKTCEVRKHNTNLQLKEQVGAFLKKAQVFKKLYVMFALKIRILHQ